MEKKMETQEITKQLTGWQRLIRFLFAPAVQIGGLRSGLIDQPRPVHGRVVRRAPASDTRRVPQGAAIGAATAPLAVVPDELGLGQDAYNPARAAGGLPLTLREWALHDNVNPNHAGTYGSDQL